ncbi:hypothetical protein B0H19DRAFT_1247662 [Mycena capillaripes]|nr:hypothetical protein B0H19DRAFT_1247662 [Mycena capillaripes]
MVSAAQSARLPQFLAGLLEAGPQSLTRLEVEIYLICGLVVPTTDWAPLANILHTTRFPALAKVEFGLAFPLSDFAEEAFTENIRRGFLRLLADGIMIVLGPDRTRTSGSRGLNAEALGLFALDMNAASVSHFPPEIIDMIIRQNDADPPTLRACALVCRAFLSSSQACIFFEVKLIPRKGRAQQLCDVLVESPHLRRHIRTLRISDAGLDWESVSQGLVVVLGLLDAVTAFVLIFENHNSGPADGHLRALSTVALVSLRLAHLGALSDLTEFSHLVSSAALTELALQDIVLPSESLTEGKLALLNKALALTDCRLDLKGLTLEIIATWLIGGESLSVVRCFHCPWNIETVSHVQNITQASRSSIQEVFLYSHDLNVSHDFSTTLSLAHLEKLRVLTVSFLIEADHSDRLVPELAALLEACPRTMSTFGVGTYLISEPEIPPVDWTPLANVLIKNSTHFPLLRNVGFGVMCMSSASDEPAERFIEGIQRGLPHLHEQGILKCVVIPQTVLTSRATL